MLHLACTPCLATTVAMQRVRRCRIFWKATTRSTRNSARPPRSTWTSGWRTRSCETRSRCCRHSWMPLIRKWRRRRQAEEGHSHPNPLQWIVTVSSLVKGSRSDSKADLANMKDQLEVDLWMSVGRVSLSQASKPKELWVVTLATSWEKTKTWSGESKSLKRSASS